MTDKLNIFERCVMCGEMTDVPISTPIELRSNYEVGCGQLCIACQKKLRSSMQKENKLSNEQIVRTVNVVIRKNKLNPKNECT